MKLRPIQIAALVGVLVVIAGGVYLVATYLLRQGNTPVAERPTDTGEAAQPTGSLAATPTEATAPTDPTAGPAASAQSAQWMAVSYAVEDSLPETLPDPPDGSRWILVVATLGNYADESITVGQDSLALIDEQDNRYIPAAPDESTKPALVGATVGKDESVLGLVRFALPIEASPARLEWCPGDDCALPLRSSIP